MGRDSHRTVEVDVDKGGVWLFSRFQIADREMQMAAFKLVTVERANQVRLLFGRGNQRYERQYLYKHEYLDDYRWQVHVAKIFPGVKRKGNEQSKPWGGGSGYDEGLVMRCFGTLAVIVVSLDG